MRPGTAHAVYTPEDCLAVGGHFYTAHTFSDSIQAIRQQIFRDVEENENISVRHFSDLTNIFENMQFLAANFTPTAMTRLEASVAQFLIDLGVVEPDVTAPLEEQGGGVLEDESNQRECRQGRSLYKPTTQYNRTSRKKGAKSASWPPWISMIRTNPAQDSAEGKDDRYYHALVSFVDAMVDWWLTTSKSSPAR